MDITPTTTIFPPPPPLTESPEPEPEPEPEIPTQILPVIRPLSFSNGVLKRHRHHRPDFHRHVAVAYKECLKNHAAAMGTHSVDGCGEFMQSPAATRTDPTSFKCAACGCHRNFHRREPDLDHPPAVAIEYQPHHRHRPLPPVTDNRGSPSSYSPPPISSSYAPDMLLSLSTGSEPPSTRKRHRTKFSPAQKEQMFRFAERLGWKILKRDDDLVREFCDEVKVDKGVLKVWMHNNKNNFVKRVVLDAVSAGDDGPADASADDNRHLHADIITNQSNGTSENNLNNNHNDDDEEDENGIDQREHRFQLGVAGGAANGGSSS